MKKLIGISVMVAMLSTLTFTQTTKGSIYGKVLQTGDSVIPGVQVTLSSDVSGQKSILTSAWGNFRFLNLDPDIYQLKFEKAGFKTVVYKGVRVYTGRSKSLEIRMQTGPAAPPVIITGGSGAVDTRSSTSVTNITKEMLQSLPTARNPWAIFNLVPGIILDREEVGGSKSGQQSTTYGPSAGDDENMWYVDGANVSDLYARGAAPAYLNTNSYEEIQVTTAANDMTAQTGGTYLNFISRRGGNRFGGDIYIYAENDTFEMKQTLPQSITDRGWGSTGIFRLNQYGANFGGPILKDKLWFYGSYGIQDIHYRTVTGEKDSTWLESMYGKIDFRFGSTSGFVRVSDDSKQKWERYRHWLGNTIQDRSVEMDQDGHTRFYIGNLRQELGDLILDAKFSYVDERFTLDPIAGDINPATGHLEGMDAVQYSLPTFWFGGSGFYYTADRTRLNLSLDGNYFIEGVLGSDHEIRFGVDYCNADATSQSLYPNQRELYIHDRNDPSGYKQIWWRTDAFLAVGYSRVSFYIADTITFSNFTANIGIRYDRETNAHNAVTIPALTFNGTPIFTNHMGQLSIPSRNIAATFEVFSPRISLSYDITGNGENVVKASFARYGSRSGYSFALFLWPIYAREIDVAWNDYDNDLVPDWGEWSGNPADWLWWNIDKTNPYNAVSPRKIDPAYNSPILTEITLGFEKALAEDFVVALNAFYKRSTNLTWNRGLFSADGSLDSAANWYIGGTYTFADGSTKDYYLRHERPDALYRTNYGSGTYNDYKAVELVVSKKLSHGWMLDASFTYSDWKSHYDPAEYFDQTNFAFFDGGFFAPQSGESETSRVYANSRWQFKIAGFAQLPYGFNVSGVFRVREGFINPYYETFPRPGIGWTTIYEPGKKFGDDRLPAFWILNLGVEKTINISPSLAVTFLINGYNITNNSTTLKVDPLLGTSTTGQPLNILNPGIFQFGMRVSF